MNRELLGAFLWKSRLALRAGAMRVFAAHGYADDAYRPPTLPFVSVLGPLGIHPDPERDPARPASLRIRTPGHIVGTPRASAQVVPANGALRVRFDGHATVTLSGLPGGAFSDPSVGPAVAQAIRERMATAVSGGQLIDPDGAPVTDTTVLASLAQATCRFDVETGRFALSSGPGAAVLGHRSAVELLPVPGDVSVALGLSPPERTVEGRWVVSRLEPPKPFTVDVRVDVWAAAQGELAELMDTVASASPTRGQLVVRPGLLAADAVDGDVTLRLLGEGEPTMAGSLAHLESSDQTHERARGGSLTRTAGAVFQGTPPTLRISGTGTASLAVAPTGLVPDPLRAPQPAPLGMALSLGVRLEPGGAAGQTVRALTLATSTDTALEVRVDILDDGSPTRVGRLVARAGFVRDAVPGIAETRWDLPMTRWQAGVHLHLIADPVRGEVSAFIDAQPRPSNASPAAPTVFPGRPLTGPNMTLTLGTAGGNPVAMHVTHLHLLAAPVGPLDPALRPSAARAAQLRPGDVITLGESRDGHRVGKRRFQAVIVEIDGDTVTLNKPVVGRWSRGSTLVFQEEWFYLQSQLRRRDDLLNHLYRCIIDYRVSAFLDDAVPDTSAPLVDQTDVQLVPLGASRLAGGHPGVTAHEVDTARRGVN